MRVHVEDGERFVAPGTEGEGAYSFRWAGSLEQYYVRKKRSKELKEFEIKVVCQFSDDHEWLQKLKSDERISEKHIDHEHG